MATEFVQESWQELKKVHWPSRKETYAATVVVIIVVSWSRSIWQLSILFDQGIQAIIG